MRVRACVIAFLCLLLYLCVILFVCEYICCDNYLYIACDVYIYIYVCVCAILAWVCVYIYTHYHIHRSNPPLSLSLSLSLYIYIYIYVRVWLYVCARTRIEVFAHWLYWWRLIERDIYWETVLLLSADRCTNLSSYACVRTSRLTRASVSPQFTYRLPHIQCHHSMMSKRLEGSLAFFS